MAIGNALFNIHRCHGDPLRVVQLSHINILHQSVTAESSQITVTVMAH